jgi:hypothetical protein
MPDIDKAILERLGIPKTEVIAVRETDDGPVVRTFDNKSYILLAEDHPQYESAKRTKGVLFYRAPFKGYSGVMPVFGGTSTTVHAEGEDTGGLRAGIGDPDKRDDVTTVEPEEDEEVPDSTIPHVLAWVGDDVERAARALEAERGRPKPRAAAIEKLEQLAAG